MEKLAAFLLLALAYAWPGMVLSDGIVLQQPDGARLMLEKPAERLVTLAHEGASIRRTKLTEAFSEEDLRRRYGEDAIILFAVRESGALDVAVSGSPLNLKTGDTVVSFAREEDDEDTLPMRSADPQGPRTPLP